MNTDTRSAFLGLLLGAAFALLLTRRRKRRFFDDDRPVIRVRNRRLEFVGDHKWVDRQSHWRLEDQRAAVTDEFLVVVFAPAGDPMSLKGEHVFLECLKEGGGTQQFKLHARPEEANKKPKLTPVSPLKRHPERRNVLVPQRPMRIAAVWVPGGARRDFPEGEDVDMDIYPVRVTSSHQQTVGPEVRDAADPQIFALKSITAEPDRTSDSATENYGRAVASGAPTAGRLPSVDMRHAVRAWR
jgi:hypothetical protein